jgi:branched-chain amino acid transport system ATP-binding protein
MTAQQSYLSVDRVTRRFGGLTAVDQVSFAMGRGDLISLIGPNGAGKTTLFNVLTGQLAPSEGSIGFDGQEVGRMKPNERARIGFGRTFQISQTLTSLSVLENVMIGAFLHHSSLRDAAERAHDCLARVDLAARANERASNLTLGERRRLEVARALALEPRLLLLDEVMAGLNQTEVTRIVDLVQTLRSEGLTIVVIEHNLKVVRAFASRVLVLDRGALLADGTPDEVLSDPAVIRSYIGKTRT